MRVSSAQASPHYLSGPHLSWLLLTICYARSFASPPGTEAADPNAYVGLEEGISADLAVYLLRSWDESEPPPSCLQDLCSTLAATLSRGALIRSRSSTLSPLETTQIKNVIAWLVLQWDMLGTGGIPSIASGWLVKIIDASGGCLEGEEPIGGGAIRPLERRSPLAIPIRRMRLAHDSLDEIKDLTRLFKILQAWRDGFQAEGTDDTPSAVGSSGRPTRIEVYAAYQEARKRGDYTATRENLTKFFELAPLSVASSSGPQPPIIRKTKIHPHALLNFAALQVESHEWDAAAQTLHETIQLARTERDEQCLQACQSLERRIKAARAVANDETGGPSSAAQDPWRASDRSIHAGSLSLDDLWEVQSSAHTGASTDELLKQMERVYAIPLPPTARPGAGLHQQHTHHKGPQVATGEPSKTIIAQDRPRPWAVAASLSEIKGDVTASDRYRHVYRSEPYRGDEERREDDELIMRMQEAWQLAESGSYDDGLALLVSPVLIENMSLADYQVWAQCIWRILYLQRIRRGDVSADTDRLASQASVGEAGIRLWNAPAHLQRLYCQAKGLVVAGAGDVALSAVESFVTAAESASAVPLVLEGKLLHCRAFAENMGRYEAASEALEEVMVQALTDHNLERRADVCATYAQCLCGPGVSTLDETTARRAREWYQRALGDYETVAPHTSPMSISTLKRLAILSNHLGDIEARDAYAERVVLLSKRLSERLGGEDAAPLRTWESLIAQVGDHVAGIKGGPLAVDNHAG